MNDEALIDDCITGDARAQKSLFDRFAPKMMGVVLRYVNDRERANDILQDSFIKVFQNLTSFKKDGSLEGWVRRIVVNTALDYLRRNKKYLGHVEINDISLDASKNSDAIGKLEEESLLTIINSLPEGYRVVFNLYAIEGYSHKEIADQLNISEKTSKSQYSRAKTAIQKLLEKYNIER
jgi:RNA polymerase sigma-70 factor (ECF subfamily)